jgi:hypothetical protein
VFLVSGLLFVGLLFVAAAVAGGLFAAAASGSGPPGAGILSALLRAWSVRTGVHADR